MSSCVKGTKQLSFAALAFVGSLVQELDAKICLIHETVVQHRKKNPGSCLRREPDDSEDPQLPDLHPLLRDQQRLLLRLPVVLVLFRGRSLRPFPGCRHLHLLLVQEEARRNRCS